MRIDRGGLIASSPRFADLQARTDGQVGSVAHDPAFRPERVGRDGFLTWFKNGDRVRASRPLPRGTPSWGEAIVSFLNHASFLGPLRERSR